MAIKSTLSVDDVCRILGEGAKSGVRELSFSGLHVHFGQPAESEKNLHVFRDPAPIPADLTDQQQDSLAKESLERDELATREDQMAELLITDPVRFEEMLRDGELTDGSRPGNSGDADIDDDGLGSE